MPPSGVVGNTNEFPPEVMVSWSMPTEAVEMLTVQLSVVAGEALPVQEAIYVLPP